MYLLNTPAVSSKHSFSLINPCQISQSLLEYHPDTLRRGRGEKEQSQDKTGLVRSKSIGSLQSNAGSIEARKARFESKAAAQNNVKTNKQSPKKSTDITQLINVDAEQVKSPYHVI